MVASFEVTPTQDAKQSLKLLAEGARSGDVACVNALEEAVDEAMMRLDELRTELAAANERIKSLETLLARWCKFEETPEVNKPGDFIELYSETQAALKAGTK